MPRYVRLGSETAVNSTYVRSQAQAETSRLANGNFITVWTDADFNTTAGRFVRAQMLQPDGTAVGGELTLFSGSFVSNPNVAGLANGGFAMTWISSTSIRVQIFDASGVATAPAFTATPTSGASSVQRPEIAGLEGGGFAVIWHDSRTTGADISGSGIRMRQYDASGTAVGGEVLVNVSTAGNQADSSVSYLVGGGFVVTWTDRGASGSGAPWLVRAQVFAADGTRVGGEITINEATTGVSSVESSVTSLSGGGFAVSWYESSFTGTSGHRIRMFDASGAPVGSVILVESGLNGTQTGPVLTALTDGSLAISWVADISALSDGAGRGIFVQIFGADGIADGPPMQVNTQANGDQIDPAIVALSDGRFAVTWTDLNTSIADDDEVRFQIFGTELPVTITSNGGGADASISILENGNAVTAVAASGSNVVYSIAGGADAALLTINPATGALSFIASPNFESPSDTGTNNVYDLVVRASSGSAFDEQTISVTVDNLNEGLSITSASAFGLAENMNAIGAVSAADIDGDTVSYVISGGADAASFTIDALTGELSFINAPNFETPGDTGGDNIYDVIVAATDGNFTEMQSIAVTVANSDEAVIFQPANGFSIDENQLLIGSLLALDPDGVPVSYSIAGGADAALFGIDAVTGALSFLTAPDFEAPADADGDNVYDVSIAASDGTSSATQSVSVNLNNINEAPSITSNGGGATASLMVVENELAVTTVESADPEGNNRVYAITGGADAARFTIDATTGALAFIAAPNFEAPADAGANNIYDVTVSASDGVLTDVQALNITVTNTNEAPVITSNGGGSTTAISVNENGLAVTTII